ncbi:MAG: undecaprenyl-diphosphatase UppP [Anaerolineales bacterium]|jgi:undecaprenyl-diphosphatase
MNIFHSFLLGILQGLTEFIPISSTAHLLIAEHFLKIPPTDPALFSYNVLIELGTTIALIVYFWKDLWMIIMAIVRGLVQRKPFEDFNARLGWLILLATIPALLAGFLLKNAVERLFANPLLESAIRLLITAVILGLVEWLGKRNRQLDSITWVDALFFGIAQVLSVFPGASRSGTTMAGGMTRGFNRPSAARFAFLMSAPVMLAAGGYESLDLLKMPGLGSFLPMLAVGFVVAAIVGWLSIKWLLNYLTKHSFYIFAGYCAILGLACLVLTLVK